MFPAALQQAFNGGGYLFDTSLGMRIMLLRDEFTEAEALAISNWSVSLSPYACTLSGNGFVRTLASTLFTTTTSVKWKFDAADITLCASVGTNVSAMFAVILQSTVTAPIFICQLSTGAIVANKLLVAFNAAGIYELSQSAAGLPGTP